ncbi:hypothetical protein SAMN06269173_10281 [Hymenobacter mucosus]|uniref:Uncharacterized protein n=1 Tax=Hymenobacter mucosus TaxID=1411120 RepID=A0A238VZE1_9BACT|nr:hypothetical protein SAMN06269173_10281 [Hymenobacter mucosus]
MADESGIQKYTNGGEGREILWEVQFSLKFNLSQ